MFSKQVFTFACLLSVSTVSFAATINVNSKSTLTSALTRAKGGDRIVLAAANYGVVEINGKNQYKNLAGSQQIEIAAASTSNRPTLTNLTMINVQNILVTGLKIDYVPGQSPSGRALTIENSNRVTLRNIQFEGQVVNGYGDGRAMSINRSSDITVESSTVKDYSQGVISYEVDGLTLSKIKMTGMSNDCVQIGHSSDVLIEDNDFVERGLPGQKHKDLIQVYNNGVSPMRGLTIRGNTLEASDAITHGIYINNEYGETRGSNNYHTNILIEDNDVRTAQFHGISVAATSGLIIRNNSSLQHSGVSSTHPVSVPTIQVSSRSKSVTITNNESNLRRPCAANVGSGWACVGEKMSGWNVSGNDIVPF